MTTARDIIERALRSINVLGVGESADAPTAQDALDTLNDVLEDWANESLMVYQQTTESFPLTSGVGTYTIGPGGDFNTVRPSEITSAYVRIGGVDYLLQPITSEQYASIGIKSLQSTIPTAFYLNPSFPLATIQFWKVPDAADSTFFMNSLKPFAAFTSLTSTVNLPPGYARALRYALELELMPEYGVLNQMVIELARDAKADLKRRNFRPSVLSIDSAIPRGRRYFDIYDRF